MSFFSDILHYSYLQKSLLLIFPMAIICGLLGPIVVAKRLSFMGESIAHSSLLGLSLAVSCFQIISSTGLFFFTVITTLLCVWPLSWQLRRKNNGADALIGIYLSVTLSLAFIIIHKNPQSGLDLSSLFFGSIFLIGTEEIIFAFVIAAVTFMIVALNYRSWFYFLVDENGSLKSIPQAKHYHSIIIFLLTLSILCLVKMAGALIINALLIFPGHFSLAYPWGAKKTFLYSFLFSLTALLLGLVLSHELDFPPGAVLGLTQFFCLVLFFIVKKIRA